MKHDKLPRRWRQWVESYTEGRKQPGRLSASDFPCDHSVSLVFPDGSTALFQFAFYVADDKRGELAVFTEHCGYHVFPLHDLAYSLIDRAAEDEGL